MPLRSTLYLFHSSRRFPFCTHGGNVVQKYLIVRDTGEFERLHSLFWRGTPKLHAGDPTQRSRAISKAINLLTEFTAMLNDRATPGGVPQSKAFVRLCAAKTDGSACQTIRDHDERRDPPGFSRSQRHGPPWNAGRPWPRLQCRRRNRDVKEDRDPSRQMDAGGTQS